VMCKTRTQKIVFKPQRRDHLFLGFRVFDTGLFFLTLETHKECLLSFAHNTPTLYTPRYCDTHRRLFCSRERERERERENKNDDHTHRETSASSSLSSGVVVPTRRRRESVCLFFERRASSSSTTKKNDKWESFLGEIPVVVVVVGMFWRTPKRLRREQ